MGRPEPPATRVVLLASLAVVVVAVDQATKAWARTSLGGGKVVGVLGPALSLRLVYNPGGALGIASGATWLLTFVAIGVVVVAVAQARRIRSLAWAIVLGLGLGGAVGNLVDRLASPPAFGTGEVTDFIAYGRLFVGNVADIAIVGAAIGAAILAARGIRLDGTREEQAR